MSGRVKAGIIAVAAVLLAGAYSVWVWPTDPNDDAVANWGKGPLSQIERAYYSRRVKRTVDFWQAAANWAAQWRDNGRIEQPNHSFLVIDIEKPAVWVEYQGQVVEALHCALPKSMKWSIHHLTPEGPKELTGIVRLQVRGVYTSRIFAETIFLAGTSREGHMTFQIRSNTCGSGQGSGGQPVLPTYSDDKPDHEDPYRSILVDEQEYAAYLAGLEAEDQGGLVDALFHGSDVLKANVTKWQDAEKHLLVEIRRQVSQMGYDLHRVRGETGPDFLAGHFEVRGQSDSLFASRSVEYYFNYEYLGQDVWHVFSAPGRFLRPMKMRNEIGLQFLVCPGRELTSEETQQWLDKGRSIYAQAPPAPSKWQATLDNNVVVEFIGLCENPSAGRTWFGPDGRELDYVPYTNFRHYGKKGDQRPAYEFAWKVNWPSQGGGRGSTSSLEGAQGSYGHMHSDRYGQDIIEGLETEGYSFKEGQTKTTLKMGLKLGEADYSRVRFENISLVRGRDMGFRIALGNEDQ